MISFTIVSYFILLATIFFVEAASFLPLIIGIGVYFYISFFILIMNEEGYKNITP